MAFETWVLVHILEVMWGRETYTYLRNEFNFWDVHGIMNTEGLLQSKWSPKGFMLTLQETQSIHDSMNRSKNEFIAYIYILF